MQERKLKRKQGNPKSWSTRPPIPQVFTYAARMNAYYVCHNASDMLSIRGFPSKTYENVITPESSEDES